MREAYAQSLVYGFGDFATIQKKTNFPFRPCTI